MDYQSLTKIYYCYPNLYVKEYEKRFNAFNTNHIDNIEIKQYNHSNAYQAFFYYNNELMSLIEQVYKEYNSFILLKTVVPAIVLHQFSLLSILEEIKSSNDIEGVRSTRKELKEILDGQAPRSARFSSVVHKYSSLLTKKTIPFKTCQDIRNFYNDFTYQEIVEDDPKNKLDGKIFRKDPVDILSASGKTIHRGISPEAKLIETMETTLKILNDTKFPALIRIAIFHYLFAYSHPFYDGNGRTDRFITSYYLANNFDTIVALRLSIIIKKNKKKYYDKFSETDSEINRGDLTPFIIYFLQLLLKTFQDTINLIKRKQNQLNIYQEKIQSFDIADEILKGIYIILLQASLFYGQGVNISDIMKITAKSRNTIQKRLDEIPNNHIIITKLGKTKYYKLNLSILK